MNSKENTPISTQKFVPIQQYKDLQCAYGVLKEQLSDLQRMIFGRKSERFVVVDDNQLELFESQQEHSSSSSTQQISYSRKEPQKHKQIPVRSKLPSHLPRVEEVIEPSQLLEGATKIGEEVTEILEYTPGNIYVRRIVRPKYANPNGEGVWIGELPSLPIPKGNAGAGLLAHIQVSKWVDHLPYYRQIQILKRMSVTLSDATLNGWFNAACDLLSPLYDCLVKEIQQQKYLQADESPIGVQDSHQQKATHTGYHWVYHAPLAKLVAFHYQPSRSREGPRIFLEDFQGTLQTDGYAAYNQLFPGHPDKITLIGCMAHARRYFEKAIDQDQPRAQHVLQVFQQLYGIEGKAKEEQMDEKQTRKLRLQQAVPLLEELKKWLEENLTQVLPKSKIGKAISYTLNLWERLIAYCKDGSYLIDNNLIENTIRPLALGRKNYLFAGSHQAAQKAAMMYSLLGTCKINKVEPFGWLKDVLERIPEHKANRLMELLPHKWTPRLNTNKQN